MVKVLGHFSLATRLLKCLKGVVIYCPFSPGWLMRGCYYGLVYLRSGAVVGFGNYLERFGSDLAEFVNWNSSGKDWAQNSDFLGYCPGIGLF